MIKGINKGFKGLFESLNKQDVLKESLGENNLIESPMYDMIPEYDSRKSFGGKAKVDSSNGVLTLISYNTPVAKIKDDKVELLPKWDSSATTLRHVKEFLKQNGFEAESLAQLKKDYLSECNIDNKKTNKLTEATLLEKPIYDLTDDEIEYLNSRKTTRVDISDREAKLIDQRRREQAELINKRRREQLNKAKEIIKDEVTGAYTRNKAAMFATDLEDNFDSSADWKTYAEAALEMGYDVYFTPHGYTGYDDYLIVYPGFDSDVYLYGLDFSEEEKKEFFKDLTKVKSIKNESMIESLKEVLNRLNEATTSSEDKADSDLIRSVLNKIGTRVNAKLTPQEQAVLDKYGIKRTGWRKDSGKLTVNGRNLDRELDNRTAKRYYSKSYNNGNPAEINYADRARKFNSTRSKANQTFTTPWSADNDVINAHVFSGVSFDNQLNAERYANALPEIERVNAMKDAIRDRKYAQNRIDNADSERADRMAKAQADYDKAKANADWWYKHDTEDAADSRDYAQKNIDKLLKKDKKDESIGIPMPNVPMPNVPGLTESADVREYTNKLLDLVDEGVLDGKDLALAALKWMSEDEVREMAKANEYTSFFESDEEDLDEFFDIKPSINLDARGFGGKDNNVSVLGGRLPLNGNNKLGEDLGSDVDKFQEWVDYDMKRYGRISKQTKKEVKEAGLKLVKDEYGDYEVIA